jgi:single-strand DNA-binding protein
VILTGRLTRDPDIKATQSGDSVARYTLAVVRPSKGEQKADFISCVAFGKNAEFASKYLFKGIKIAILGRIQTGSYTNQNGQKIYTTDVIVDHHEFCERKTEQGGTAEVDSTGFASLEAGEDLPF